MSERNVETVKRIYELAHDLRPGGGGAAAQDDQIRELWDPDLVIEEMADFPDQATYRGYDGLQRWWAGFFEVYDEIRLQPREFFCTGDRVVVRVDHLLHSKAGVAIEYHGSHVWTIRDGRAVHVTGYRELGEALASVGLPAPG